MKQLIPLFLLLLGFLVAPQTVFSQTDVNVGGTVGGEEEKEDTSPTLESPTSKIKEPVIGPPKAATGTTGTGEEGKTTLFQFPEEEQAKPFLEDQREFLLGLMIASEVGIIVFLIRLIRQRRKKLNQP